MAHELDENGLPILRKQGEDLLNDQSNPFEIVDDLLGADMLRPEFLIMGASAQLANGRPAMLLYGSRSLFDIVLEYPKSDTVAASLCLRMASITQVATTDLAKGMEQLLGDMR